MQYTLTMVLVYMLFLCKYIYLELLRDGDLSLVTLIFNDVLLCFDDKSFIYFVDLLRHKRHNNACLSKVYNTISIMVGYMTRLSVIYTRLISFTHTSNTTK